MTAFSFDDLAFMASQRWTPEYISTALWLDGADTSTMYSAVSGGFLVANGGAVTRWEDKSGNNRHATEATNQPIRQDAATNSLTAIRFDGVNDKLSIINEFLDGSKEHTISFVYARKSNTSQYMPAVSIYGPTDYGSYHFIKNDSRQAVYLQAWGNADPAGTASTAINSFAVVQFRAQTNQWFLNVNGTQEYASSVATLGTISHDGLAIGYQTGTSRFTNMDFCELVVCTGSVATDERQRVEGYLAHKWGLAANLPSGHPYKTSAP